jgi:hypothetical protein
MTQADQSTLDALAERFATFAIHDCHDASPLYERLTRGIAGDPQLLALAAQATSRPVTNLFLAAVQFLLRGTTHELAAFYPSLTGSPAPTADPYPVFRAFCLEHTDAIVQLLQTRRVQTNEVRRCAVLLPAFGLVAAQAQARPLTLIEIGASAGLNLLWDRYGYDYGLGWIAGDPTAPLQLTCELRGAHQPPIPRRLPQVASRCGIDLHPIDLHDQQAINWLRALIWPEQHERVTRLERAVVIAQRDPPTIYAGDALDRLPALLAAVPEQTVACVFHSFVINQFTDAGRARLRQIFEQYGAHRDLYCISILGISSYPELSLLSFVGGIQTERMLATCSGHANWLAWQDAA